MLSHMKKVCVCMIGLILSCSVTYAQNFKSEFSLNFRVGNATIETGQKDNANNLSELDSFICRLGPEGTIEIVNVYFCGSASPEGSYQINQKLSTKRISALEKYIGNQIEIPDSLIVHDPEYIPWNYLREQVLSSDMADKQEVIDILALDPILVKYQGNRLIDHRILKLQSLKGGKVWQNLFRSYFMQMRNATVIFTYRRDPDMIVNDVPSHTGYAQTSLQDPKLATHSYPETVKEPRGHYLFLSTNLLCLGAAVANAAIETEISKHLTVSVPVYYSALDYFKPTLKFRTLAIQPELRYWFNEEKIGFYTGAHLGVAQFNVAFDGEVRYQDKDGDSPTYGAGLSIGYRVPLSRNQKWNLDFYVGAGVYQFEYDRFHNVPNGKLIGSYEKTYFGLDNASISLTYRFGIKGHRK